MSIEPEQHQFKSKEEVLEKALQLLQCQHVDYDNWVKDTRTKLNAAQQEVDRGESIPLDVAMAQMRFQLHQNRTAQD
jgi:Arc/MetJ-type ribon-helix-helix transcriptional regulator